MSDFSSEIFSIIRATRELSLPGWGKAPVEKNKGGGAGDVVTKIDLAIEERLAKEFARVDSSISFAGEEFGGDRNAKRFWLVDPIDGTAHYVRGLPFATTMVALVENGQVTLAAIYDFLNDALYHAERGKGAFRNDEPIHVSDRSLDDAYLYYESRLDHGDNLDVFLKLSQKADLLNFMCAGYDYAAVASGKIEGRICKTPFGKDYDYTPGALLVAEAGGVAANIGSRAFDFRNLDSIVSNKQVYAALTEGADAVFPVK